MKILLASDSHGHDEYLKQIANKHNDCDIYLLLGDSQSNKESIYPFISVRGNCDYYGSDFSRFLNFYTPFGKLYAEHIPFHQVSLSDLLANGFKVYLCGHTHVKKYEIKEGIHIINPGSLAYPRDKGSSYAILELNKGQINVVFYPFP